MKKITKISSIIILIMAINTNFGFNSTIVGGIDFNNGESKMDASFDLDIKIWSLFGHDFEIIIDNIGNTTLNNIRCQNFRIEDKNGSFVIKESINLKKEISCLYPSDNVYIWPCKFMYGFGTCNVSVDIICDELETNNIKTKLYMTGPFMSSVPY